MSQAPERQGSDDTRGLRDTGNGAKEGGHRRHLLAVCLWTNSKPRAETTKLPTPLGCGMVFGVEIPVCTKDKIGQGRSAVRLFTY